MKHLLMMMALLVVLVGCGGQANPTSQAVTSKPSDSLPVVATATLIPNAGQNPTTAPNPTATANQATERQITISQPTDGATIGNEFQLVGNASYAPFEKNFAVEILDTAGTSLHKQGMLVQGEYGGPTSFDTAITWQAPSSGEGIVRVAEYSMNDGSLVAKAEVKVKFGASANPSGTINITEPANGATVSAPATIKGNLDHTPFEKNLGYKVYDQNNQQIGGGSIMVTGEYGGPSTFEAKIEFTQPANGGTGRIELLESDESGRSPYLSKGEVNVKFAESGGQPGGQAEGITLSSPTANAQVGATIDFSGNASYTPFEKNLGVRVFDSEGNIIAQDSLLVDGEYGGPSTFNGSISYTQPATSRPGKLVVYDTSAADGSITAQAEVMIELKGYDGKDSYIHLPATNAVVSLPLHVEASNINPEKVVVRLVFDDGTVLEQETNKINNNVVMNLDWQTESAPPNPTSQHATLEIANAANGKPLVSQEVNFTNRADELLMPIKVYWLAGEQLQEVTRYVPKSPSVATAALRELSWGPAGNESGMAGFETALARPNEIGKNKKGDWSNRAYLQSIKIENGTAYVDWSPEMAAWGGGSARLKGMIDQVTMTLKQFPTIQNVKMTIDGSESALQP